jgi:hypothetical protein
MLGRAYPDLLAASALMGLISLMSWAPRPAGWRVTSSEVSPVPTAGRDPVQRQPHDRSERFVGRPPGGAAAGEDRPGQQRADDQADGRADAERHVEATGHILSRDHVRQLDELRVGEMPLQLIEQVARHVYRRAAHSDCVIEYDLLDVAVEGDWWTGLAPP